jgi:hypothetical protein
MSTLALVELVKNYPEDAALDWRQIREDIHTEHETATAEERVILLGLFTAVMDLVERNVQDAEELQKFREIRSQDYSLLIVKEAMVGDNVCTQTLHDITGREIEEGRMPPDHELRKTAAQAIAAPFKTRAALIVEASVAHARKMLASQMPLVDAGKFDLMPQINEKVIRLYLIGVLMRYSESFGKPDFTTRELAIISMLTLLIEDGKSHKESERCVDQLMAHAPAPDGAISPIVVAGYEATERDGSLARAFESLRANPIAAGAPYRLLNRSKSIAAILALATCCISLLIGRTFLEAVGIGVIIGLSTLAIALVLYKQMIAE